MKQQTAMQDLIKHLSDITKLHTVDNIKMMAILLLDKERQQIEEAVDNTIDAYIDFIECSKAQPPMNGSDYYTQKYQ